MSQALAIINSETSAPENIREKICLIETQPQADWFVPAKTKRGRQVWYLRFRMTGWNARLYGPFKSKRACLLFLDDAIEVLQEAEPDVSEKAYKRMVKEPCAKAWLPLVEHPVIGHRQSDSTQEGQDVL